MLNESVTQVNVSGPFRTAIIFISGSDILGEVGRGIVLGHVLLIVTEVDLLSRLVNVRNVLRRKVGRAVERSNLLDVGLVLRRRDRDNALLDRPEEEDGRLVDTVRLGDALEYGLEWPAGRVAEERGEGAVGFRDDAVLLLELEERLKLRQEVRVELNFCGSAAS